MPAALREDPTLLQLELVRKPRCGLCAHYPINEGEQWRCPVFDSLRRRQMKPPRLSGGRSSDHYICFIPMSELAYERYLILRGEVGRIRPRSYKDRRLHTPEELKAIREKHLAWRRERYRELLSDPKNREKVNEYKHEYRKTHPRTEEGRRYKKRHPDEILARIEIDNLNPLTKIMARFRYKPKGCHDGRDIVNKVIREYDPLYLVELKLKYGRDDAGLPFDTHLTKSELNKVKENPVITGDYQWFNPLTRT